MLICEKCKSPVNLEKAKREYQRTHLYLKDNGITCRACGQVGWLNYHKTGYNGFEGTPN